MGGVKSQTTRKTLLSEDRTFDKALKVAQADELAEKESKRLVEITDVPANPQVQAVVAQNHKDRSKPVPTPSTAGGKKCYRCDSTQHLADKCVHANSTSNYCHKRGPLAKVCFKRKKESGGFRSQTNLVTTKSTSEGKEVDMFSIDTVYMRNVNSSANCPLYKFTTTIEDKDVVMEIDMGSTVTLLSSSDFKRLGASTNSLNPAIVIPKSYTGDTIKCLGEKEMRMKVGDQVHDLTIRVVARGTFLVREGHDE